MMRWSSSWWRAMGLLGFRIIDRRPALLLPWSIYSGNSVTTHSSKQERITQCDRSRQTRSVWPAGYRRRRDSTVSWHWICGYQTHPLRIPMIDEGFHAIGHRCQKLVGPTLKMMMNLQNHRPHTINGCSDALTSGRSSSSDTSSEVDVHS